MSERDRTAPARLRIDPIACDGIGMCAHLAPGLIVLDTWGYPIVTGDASGPAGLRAARAAAAGCPRRALVLETASAPISPRRDQGPRRPPRSLP
jgi:ferredoxin